MEQFEQQSIEVLCGEDPSTGVSVGCLPQHTSPSTPTVVQQSTSIPGFFNSLPPDMPVPYQFPLSYYSSSIKESHRLSFYLCCGLPTGLPLWNFPSSTYVGILELSIWIT
jgi:hypothetical protein